MYDSLDAPTDQVMEAKKLRKVYENLLEINKRSFENREYGVAYDTLVTAVIASKI